jgi:hypothetical protein
MGCGKTGPPTTKRLRTTQTAGQFEPYTDWIPAVGLDKVKMVIKRKSVQLAGTAPTFNVKPAIQIALVRPDNPDDWAVIGNPNPFTGGGEDNTGVLDVSATTAGKFFVRFGVQYYLGGTSPTDGQADVEVQVSYVSCGSIVGTMTQELQAFNTTTDSFVAITGWVPAMDAEKAVAAFVISDLANNFRTLLVYRKAATSIQTPSGWTSLEGTTYRTANGETTTGEVTLTVGTDMFVQFGVAFSQSSAGSAPGRATVSTSVAVRRT